MAHDAYMAGCRGIAAVVLALWVIWVSFPPSAWAKIDLQIDDAPPGFKEGSNLKITETAITLYESNGVRREQRVRWSVPAENAYHSLFFETAEGVQCLFYLTPRPDKRIGLHALRLDDGNGLWNTEIMVGATLDLPVRPVFAAPWIYIGQGTWLERLNPEDGTIVQRYPMREIIREVAASPDGSLEVGVETSDAGQVSIQFHEGQWFPHITVSSSLSGGSLLMNRAMVVMPDFAGTLDPSDYQGYLDLHRIKKTAILPEDIITWRNFNLTEAEAAYREAMRYDQANPYLPLFLALARYYQGQSQAVTASINDALQEALQKSAGFWEESLRLGAICDSLGHTVWADAFYEQGLARYFQEVPAPAQEISLDEVLSVFLQQQSSALFAAGHTDRALHIQDLRRQIFPYTEGDNLFSRRYAAWLRHNGQAEKARQEQRRIGKRTLIFDALSLTPLSVWSFGVLGILLLFFIVLKNDIRHWSELIVLAALIAVLDSAVSLDLLGTLNLPLRAFAHVAGLTGYVALIAWLRQRRTSVSKSFRRTLALVAMSSYVVLLRGTLPAYYIGFHLTQSQVGAKYVEILFVVLFLGIYVLLRPRFSPPPKLRHGWLFALGFAVYMGWYAWLHQWGSCGIITMNFPQPWADKGHPKWVTYIGKQTENIDYQHQNMQFLQALVHHLHGDVEVAKQLYQPLTQDARALNNLGVLMAEHDRQAAKTYFQQALQYAAEFPPALYNLGVLTGNRAAIEQARAADAWLPSMYQRYAPERLWIVNPELAEWSRMLYWSRGGFLFKSLLELMVRLTNPAELFQADLQQLR